MSVKSSIETIFLKCRHGRLRFVVTHYEAAQPAFAEHATIDR